MDEMDGRSGNMMMALSIGFNPESFKQYLNELHEHLFGQQTVGKLMKHTDSHRVRRYLTMWILQDKKTFDFYYERRFEFGMKNNFDQAIAGLTQLQGQLVDDIQETLAVTADMGDEVDSYAIKEFRKDLCNFSYWYRQR